MIRIMTVLIDTFFNDMTEMADKALHWPGSSIAQRAKMTALLLMKLAAGEIKLP